MVFPPDQRFCCSSAAVREDGASTAGAPPLRHKDFVITGGSSQTLDRTIVQAGRTSFNILDSVLFFSTLIRQHVKGGVGPLEPDPGT